MRVFTNRTRSGEVFHVFFVFVRLAEVCFLFVFFLVLAYFRDVCW